MAEKDTEVTYKAKANFSDLIASVEAAQAKIAALRAEEAAANAESIKGSKEVAAARIAATAATKGQTTAVEDVAKAEGARAKAVKEGVAATESAAKAEGERAKATTATTKAVRDGDAATSLAARGIAALRNILDKHTTSLVANAGAHRAVSAATLEEYKSYGNLQKILIAADDAGSRLAKTVRGLDITKLGALAPALMPAGITALGAGIGAAIGPAVTLLQGGAVAALGIADNIAQIGPAAMAVIPAMASMLSVIGTMKVATSGIGSAITGAMKINDQQAMAQYAAAHPIPKPPKGAIGAASVAAQQAQNYAMSQLSPSAQKFASTMAGLGSGAMNDAQSNVQESFFAPFVKDLGSIKSLVTPVQNGMEAIAKAVGGVADQVLRVVTTKGFESFLTTWGKATGGLITTLGPGLVAMLGVFKDLVTVSAPFLSTLAQDITNAAGGLQKFMDAGTKSGALAQDMETAYTTMQQWWDILKNVGTTLINYTEATKGLGQWLTNGLQNLTLQWVQMSEAAKMPGSNFQKFLTNIQPVLSTVKTMLGDFMSWWVRTAEDPKSASALNDILKGFIDLGHALSPLITELTQSGLATDLIAVAVSVVKLATAFINNANVIGIIHDFYTVLKIFVDFLTAATSSPIGAWLVGFVPLLVGLGAAMVALNTAMRFTGLNALLGVLGKIAAIPRIFELLAGLPVIGKAMSLLGATDKTGATVAQVLTRGAGVTTAEKEAATVAGDTVAGSAGGSMAAQFWTWLKSKVPGFAETAAPATAEVATAAAEGIKIENPVSGITTGLYDSAGEKLLSKTTDTAATKLGLKAAEGEVVGTLAADAERDLSRAGHDVGQRGIKGLLTGLKGALIKGAGLFGPVGVAIAAVVGAEMASQALNSISRQQQGLLKSAAGYTSDFNKAPSGFTAGAQVNRENTGLVKFDSHMANAATGNYMDPLKTYGNVFTNAQPLKDPVSKFFQGIFQPGGDPAANAINNEDQALSNLVKHGNGSKAADIFTMIEADATKAHFPLDQLMKEFPKLGKAITDTNGVWDDAAKRLRESSDLWKTNAGDVFKSAQQWDDEVIAVKQADDAFTQNAIKVKDSSKFFDANTAAGAANKNGFLNALAAIKQHSDTISDHGKKQAAANVYTLKSVQDLQNQALKAGASKKAVADLTSQLLGIPPHIVSNVDIRAAQALATAKELADRLDKIHDKSITITANGNGAAFSDSRNSAHNTGSTGGLVPRGFAVGGAVGLDEWQGAASDTVPAWLTPGEFVLRKSVVDKIGVQNLRGLNSGMQSYASLLSDLLGGAQKMKSHAPVTGLTYPKQPMLSTNNRSAEAPSQGPVINMIVNNPKAEPASDTLPRAVRKVGYLYSTR